MAEDNDPYPRQSFNNKDDVAFSWSNVWEWGTSLRAYRLANRGYKVENVHLEFKNLHGDRYLMNGFSHHYHLGESTFIFRGIRSDFFNF